MMLVSSRVLFSAPYEPFTKLFFFPQGMSLGPIFGTALIRRTGDILSVFYFSTILHTTMFLVVLFILPVRRLLPLSLLYILSLLSILSLGF